MPSKPSTATVDIRLPYEARVRVTKSFPPHTMAKQSFKAECDINTIMQKYQQTGLLDHVQRVQGSYGDFTSVADYQLHLDQVLAAQDAFMALPSSVRKRFDNDPSHLLGFLADPANRDEAIALGLVSPPSAPQPKEGDSPTGGGGTPPTSTPEPKAKPANEGSDP